MASWLDILVANETAYRTFIEYLDKQVLNALWKHTAHDADHSQINGEIYALRNIRGLIASYRKEAIDDEVAVEGKQNRGGPTHG